MTTLGFNIKFIADGESDLPEWYFSAVTAFFFLSLAVNALVTGLIVYRIINVYNDIRGFSTNLNNNNSNSGYGGSTTGQRNLYPLISILIESGLITFVAQLAQTIMYKSATAAFPLVGGSVVVLYVRELLFFSMSFLGNDNLPFFFFQQGISTTVVLVRVDTGVSYENNTSRTAHSTDSGRPMHLWKLNH